MKITKNYIVGNFLTIRLYPDFFLFNPIGYPSDRNPALSAIYGVIRLELDLNPGFFLQCRSSKCAVTILTLIFMFTFHVLIQVLFCIGRKVKIITCIIQRFLCCKLFSFSFNCSISDPRFLSVYSSIMMLLSFSFSSSSSFLYLLFKLFSSSAMASFLTTISSFLSLSFSNWSIWLESWPFVTSNLI